MSDSNRPKDDGLPRYGKPVEFEDEDSNEESPHEDSSRGASSHEGQPGAGRRWVLTASLWSSALLSTPALLLLYVYVAAFGTILAADALEGTRGLVGSTYGGGFWLAFVTSVVAVLGGTALRYRWRDRSDMGVARIFARPSVALLSAFIVGGVVMTGFEGMSVDVPDIVSTTAILGAIFYVWFVLPFGLGGGLWRLTRALQKWGSSTRQRATAVSTTAPVAMLAFTAALTSPFVVEGVEVTTETTDEQTELKIDRATDALESSADAGPVEGSRRFLEVLADDEPTSSAQGADEAEDSEEVTAAQSNDTPSSGATLAPGSGAKSCFELLTDEDSDGSSEVDRQIQRVRRKVRDRGDAEDIVRDTLVDVCVRHGRDGIDGNVYAYFNRAVDNAAADHFNAVSRRKDFARSITPLFGLPSRDDDYFKRAFQACMAKLDDEERELIRIYYVETDKSYKAIEARFGISYDYARKKVSRARKSARVLCDDIF